MCYFKSNRLNKPHHPAAKIVQAIKFSRNSEQIQHLLHEAKVRHEDGPYALHYAIRTVDFDDRGASAKIVEMISEAFKGAARTPDGKGNLPLHLALEHSAPARVAHQIWRGNPEASKKKNSAGEAPLDIFFRKERGGQAEDSGALIEILLQGLSPLDVTRAIPELHASPSFEKLIKRRVGERLKCELGGYFGSLVSIDIELKDSIFQQFQAHLLEKKSKSIRFLWHASQAPDQIFEHGMKISYASMAFNVFGTGLYLAPDAKLSSYYAKPTPDGESSLICA